MRNGIMMPITTKAIIRLCAKVIGMRLMKLERIAIIRSRLQNHSVALHVEAADQVFDADPFLLRPCNLEMDGALIHHDEPISVSDGVAHIVDDHQSGEAMRRDGLDR